MVQRALVVVVGGADEGVPQPRQREDRAPGAGRDDRAADERQIVVVDRDVRAAARTDARQLGLAVELLGPQLVRPDAGRVDDVRCTHVEGVAALDVEHRDPAGAAVALEQPRDLEAVRADGPEALGLAEHREDEAHVVGLAVVEQVPARRLARGERGQQLDDLLAGDHAMARRAPGLPTVRRRRRGDVVAAAALGTSLAAAARAQFVAGASAGRSPTSRRRGSARRPSAGPGGRPRRPARRAAAGAPDAGPARPSAGARAAPRARARGRSSAGSAGRRGRACSSGSRCPRRSRRARAAPRCSRGWPRRAPRRRP